MNVLSHRIEEHIAQLSKFTSTPENGVTRVVYSEEDKKAKNYLKKEMKKLSLEVREDELGNIFGTWRGKNSELSQVWTGSHVDAPINGGKYDGVVGVISAIEAIRLLQANNYKPERDIVIVVFVAEEPTKFGVGCLGSRALTGMVTEEEANDWQDENGQTLSDVLQSLGKDFKKIINEQLNPKKVKTFIELHIEQGPVLEEVEKPIGIVNIISAPTEISLTITGEQRHAGSTPMEIRKDPVPAAAEIVLIVEKLTKRMSETSVGTVGHLKLTPSTSNVIAHQVELSIDIRDIKVEKKERIVNQLKVEVEKLIKKRGLTYKWEIKANDIPEKMNNANIELIKHCSESLGLTYHIMHSGAYHDALIMSSKVNTNLIFIPSTKGISHAPEEFTSTYYIAKGIELLGEYFKKITIK